MCGQSLFKEIVGDWFYLWSELHTEGTESPHGLFGLQEGFQSTPRCVVIRDSNSQAAASKSDSTFLQGKFADRYFCFSLFTESCGTSCFKCTCTPVSNANFFGYSPKRLHNESLIVFQN